MTKSALAAIAIMLAYPLVILPYLALRAWKMRQTGGV